MKKIKFPFLKLKSCIGSVSVFCGLAVAWSMQAIPSRAFATNGQEGGTWPEPFPDIDSVFAYAPEHLLPLLGRNARLDIVDYASAGMEAKVENKMGGVTILVEKNDSLIDLQLTPASRWQLKMVHDAGGKVRLICTHICFLPEPYEVVKQFDEHWLPL